MGLSYIPSAGSIASVNGQQGNVQITPQSIGAVDNDTIATTHLITGWVRSDSDVNISFNESTRIFTISPIFPATDFFFYAEGIKFVKTGDLTLEIPNITGYYHVYFDKNGVLKATITSFFSEPSNVFVSIIYWNATQGKAVYVSKETHGQIERNLHLRLHSQGSIYKSGLVINNYTILGNGSLNSDAQISISGGEIMDEDILIHITHSDSPDGFNHEQKISPILYSPIVYIIGNDFQKSDATQFPVKMGTSRTQYNKNTAGVWSLQDVESDDQYIAMWVFATSDTRHPIITMMGQRTDSNLENAKTNNLFANLSFGNNVPFVEFRLLYRLIYKVSSAYSNSVKAKLEDVTDQRNITAIQVSAITVANHNDLTNRADSNAHPATAVSYNNISSGLSATNTQNAVDELQSLKVDKRPDATVNNFAIFNDEGNIVDSGHNDSSYVASNVSITSSTKTKITYDAKGLVTSGANATTADIIDSTNKRYITDAQLVVVGNTSGANTGDESQTTIKTKLGVASSGVDGYLSGANWNTFNGKQNAISYGSLYEDNDTGTSLVLTNANQYYQWTSSTAGLYSGITLSTVNDNMLIVTTGIYKVDMSISLEGNKNSDTLQIYVFVNGAKISSIGGREEVENAKACNIASANVLSLTANDVVDIRIVSNVANTTVKIYHVNLNLMKIG